MFVGGVGVFNSQKQDYPITLESNYIFKVLFFFLSLNLPRYNNRTTTFREGGGGEQEK